MQRHGNMTAAQARLRFLLNGDVTPQPVYQRSPNMVDVACQFEPSDFQPVDGVLPNSVDGVPSDRPDVVREHSTAREPATPPATTTTSRRSTTPLRRTLELEEAIEKFDDCADVELKTAEGLRAQGLDLPMGGKGVKGEYGGLDRGVEEDGCGVRCLYVAVQCCECAIL